LQFNRTNAKAAQADTPPKPLHPYLKFPMAGTTHNKNACAMAGFGVLITFGFFI